jgi:nucleotide-binding universal stress UspA family protein
VAALPLLAPESAVLASHMAVRRIESIFHPSDFSQASEIAFAHALKIALVSGAALNMMHVAADPDADWGDFPGVRQTLERWGLIPAGSPKSAVAQLGIDVTKIIASSSRPVKACIDFLDRHPADLIVLAVRQFEGRMQWLEKSVGGTVARRAGEATLYLPPDVSGFVAVDDGSLWLRNILIPVAAKPQAQPAVEAVMRMISSLQLPPGRVTLLHVGSAEDAPRLSIPATSDWTWHTITHPGEPVEIILRVAADVRADLIVMTTEGPHGFLDALRGSTAERVLRQARSALLALPVDRS